MPTIIDSLVVALSLDSSKFTAGQKQASVDLKTAKENAATTAKSIEASGKQAAQFFTKLRNEAIGFFTVFMGARGLADFARSITTSDAAVGRMAHNLNMSTEGLSAWGGAAERVGGSAAGIEGSMQSLTSEFQNFALTGHSSVIPLFRALGVSVADASGKMRPMDDLLLDLSDKFSKMDPARASAMGRMLGLDQGTINLLEQGRAGVQKLLEEQRKLGVVSQKDSENAQRLQKNFLDLRQAFTSVGRTIINELSPGVVELLKHWSQWLKDNHEWLKLEIEKKVHETAIAVRGFVVEVNSIVIAMGGWKTVSEEIFAIWAISKVLGLVRGIGMVASALGVLRGGGAAAGGGLFGWIGGLLGLGAGAGAAAVAVPLAAGAEAGRQNAPMVDEYGRVIGNWGGKDESENPDAAPGVRQRPLDEHHRPLPQQPSSMSRALKWLGLGDANDSYKPVRDLIGKSEGTDKGRGYNETLSYGKYTGGDQNLTEMTLDQVYALQDKMLKNGAPSTAVGRYQFINKTLKSLADELGLDPSKAKFDQATQDKLANLDIDQRGGKDLVSGKLSANDFQRNMSKEWASLVNPDTGQSYYGQGVGASTAEFQVAAARVGKQPDQANTAFAALQAGVRQAQSDRPDGSIRSVMASLRRRQEAARGGRMMDAGATMHNSSNEVHVAQITVNTRATDAKGIAKGIGQAMKEYAIVPQSNYGLA